MSRSVSYQSGAVLIKYTHFETQQRFEDTFENIKYALKSAFPSFEFISDLRHKSQTSSDERAWLNADRECCPVLRNGSCIVYLAEYGGLISISFCPAECCGDDNFPHNFMGIQEHWIQAAEKKINTAIESVTERLVCCGRFSNGEALFSVAATN